MFATLQTEMFAFQVDGYNVTIVRLDTELREDQMLDMNALKARMLPFPYIKTSNEAVEAVERDADYYLEMAEFEIDDALYSAPKVLLPIPARLESDSSSPVTVTGLCTSDIEAVFTFLLSASLPPLSDPFTPLSNEQWLQLLKCASAWGITTYRDLAFSQLDKNGLTDLDRLILGRKYSNKAWVLQAYQSMAMRGGPLAIDEIEALGIQNGVKMIESRRDHISEPQLPVDQSQVSASSTGKRGPYWGGFAEMCKGLVKLAGPSHTVLPYGSSEIDRLQIALNEGVLEWVKSSFTALIQRERHLTIEEVETLDLSRQCLLDIVKAREHHIRHSKPRGNTIPPKLERDGALLIDEAFQRFLADSFPSVKLAPVSPASRLVRALERGYESWIIHECGEFLICLDTIPLSEVEILGTTSYLYLAHHKECYEIRKSHSGSRKFGADELALIAEWVDEEMGSG